MGKADMANDTPWILDELLNPALHALQSEGPGYTRDEIMKLVEERLSYGPYGTECPECVLAAEGMAPPPGITQLTITPGLAYCTKCEFEDTDWSKYDGGGGSLVRAVDDLLDSNNHYD